ncbi:secreted protein [mine drainage metagenome]|uniref:Secreted protein n=1 Tax=mine drainage metagenome TaxID=410659 RepID=T1AGF0_9ZZZZ
MNKTLPLLVTLCAALLLSACGAATTGSDPVSASAPGAYVAIARGRVGVEGGLLQVRAAVPGLVKAVSVATNAKVAAGQTLVRLDDDAAQIAVQLAGADLAQARAQQAELVAGQPAAELRAQRLAAAAAADAASGQELAEARAALGELRARCRPPPPRCRPRRRAWLRRAISLRCTPCMRRWLATWYGVWCRLAHGSILMMPNRCWNCCPSVP